MAAFLSQLGTIRGQDLGYSVNCPRIKQVQAELRAASKYRVNAIPARGRYVKRVVMKFWCDATWTKNLEKNVCRVGCWVWAMGLNAKASTLKRKASSRK